MRRLIPVLVGLSVVTFLVTTLLLVQSRNATAGAAPDAPLATPPMRYAELILEPDAVGEAAAYYWLRSPTQRWTEEQVRRFWVPPEQIALGILRQENDEIVEDILAGVP